MTDGVALETSRPAKKGQRQGLPLLRWVLLPFIAAGVGFAAHKVSEEIIARSLREDAVTTAMTWRGYFSGGFDGLDQVVRTGWLTPPQRDFITAAGKVGRVFRLRLFDARGRLVLESDKAGAVSLKIPLRDHDAGAVKAIETQRIVSNVIENGTVAALPAVYAEAHVPLLASDGEVLGLVKVQVDQSRMASLFRQALHGFALSLAALIAAGLLGLTVASSLRRRKKAVAGAAPARGGCRPFGGAYRTQYRAADMRVPQPRESFDDWLAGVIENAAQNIPERIGFECHLGLGEAVLPFDALQVETIVSGLVRCAAAALTANADDAGNMVVLMPRIVISTRYTSRGVEVSVADNRPQPAGQESSEIAVLRELVESAGGGLDIQDAPAPGATHTAWWPSPLQQARAA